MKKILIAASIVGAAAASMIMYIRRRNSIENRIEDAAGDANNIMNKHLRKVERTTNQALG
jgi:hypothetical protein